MTRVIKPMLAATYGEDIQHHELQFPLLASPKIDGIRALVVDGVVMSRSGKPIPCPTVQRRFGHLEGLDGELGVGPITARNLMQRSMRVMKVDEMTPEDADVLSFNVFDYWPGGNMCYEDRLDEARRQLIAWPVHGARLVPHMLIECPPVLDAYEVTMLEQGFEGVMLNAPKGPYKFGGRCGKKAPWLIKVKRFRDDEAVIIGWTEMMHNDNEAFKDELGRTKRSTCQEGMRPAGILGSLRLRVTTGPFAGVEFDCSGFTAAQRAQLFREGDGLLGKLGTFKHFYTTGAKDKPRQPVWKGFRAVEDTSND